MTLIITAKAKSHAVVAADGRIATIAERAQGSDVSRRATTGTPTFCEAAQSIAGAETCRQAGTYRPCPGKQFL